ncbi:hypothetical protein [uncultured Leifsonia sp.]|nr:hypothetical protein [uncultured Leifsonia sp.]
MDALRRSPDDAAARARLDGFLADTQERRVDLARQLEMADEFSALLREL